MKKLLSDINSRINSALAGLEGGLDKKLGRYKLHVAAAAFVVMLVCLFSYIGFFKFIGKRPSSIHISAQCQRASVALNYYKTDMNFFKPKIHRRISGEGITGVEFPIIYYLGAVSYKLFGFNEAYLRSINLIVVSLGICFLFLLFYKVTKNLIVSFMLVTGGILSPVLLFYTPNFMPDAPSMALTCAAWFYFFSYLQSNRRSALYAFVSFATLAALIKASSFIVFAIVASLIMMDSLGWLKNKEGVKVFRDRKRVVLGLLLGALVVFSWYFYAHYISKRYHNMSFALSPMMVNDLQTIKEIFNYIRTLWRPHYYSYESYVLLISIGILIVLGFKYLNRLLLAITVLYLLGSAAYVYLFLYQFRHHDYYIIAILPAVFFIFLTFGEAFSRMANEKYRILNILFAIILFFNLKESVIYCRSNYYERNSSAIYYWTGDFRAYEDLEPKLRKWGIKRTDLVISGIDDSYSASLYLMDQPGVCVSNEVLKDSIAGFINNKAMKYLILNDSAKFNHEYPNHFERNIIGYHRGLTIYKIK